MLDEIHAIQKYYDRLTSRIKRNKIKNMPECLLKTQLKIKLDRAKLKKSSIHGRGVFATCDIKKDNLITLYPCHIPLFDNNVSKKHLKYSFFINKKYSIIGLPHITNDPSYLGHMINEGSKCFVNKDVYYNSSFSNRNCDFYIINDWCVGIVATRDIFKNEELLITYGYGYWNMARTP